MVHPPTTAAASQGPPESDLQAIINANPDVAMLIDRQGLVIAANEATVQRLGLPLDRLIGRCIYDFLPPEAARIRRRYVDLVVNTGQPASFEDERDNRFFEHFLQPVIDAQGRVQRVAITGIDITTRKQHEASLRQQQELLEAIRQAQALFISRRDRAEVFGELLKILVGNTNSQYGFLDEVLLDEQGQPYKLSLALSDISWDAASRHLYQQLVARNLEFRNLNNLSGAPALTAQVIIANDAPHDPRSGGLPPGHPPLSSFMGIPLFCNGEMVGVAGVANRPGGYSLAEAKRIEPLTSACAQMIWALRLEQKEQQTAAAQRASEAALRINLEKYRLLIESFPLGITISDEQGNIIETNRQSERLLGLPAADHHRRHIAGPQWQLLQTDGRPLPPAEFPSVRALAENRLIENVEIGLVTPPGQITWLNVTAAPIPLPGYGVLIAYSDITERKQKEAVLAARLKLNDLTATHTLAELLQQALNEAEQLTGSQTGFFHLGPVKI